jgi:NitT/TauT family transport system substrate-binding protein
MTSDISRRRALGLVGGTMAASAAATALPFGRALAQDKPLVRVSIIPIFAVAPHFVADKEGYFGAEGISVTTQPVQTGAVGIPALISGAFDVLYSSTVPVLIAMERGIDLRIIAESTRVPSTPPDGVALFKRKGDPMAGGKDLEGKTVAINAKFGFQWLAVSKWAKKTGGDPSKIDFREIPFPSMIDALKNKQVDAAFMLDPFKMSAFEDPALELLSWATSVGMPGVSTSVWVVSGKSADEKPDLIRKYQRGFMKGGQWVNDNFGKPPYIELVAGFTKMDPAKLAQSATEPQVMEMDPKAINAIGGIMREFDLLKGDIDVASKIFK